MANLDAEEGDPLALRVRGSAFNHRAAARWKNGDGDPVPFLFLAVDLIFRLFLALDLIFRESRRNVVRGILCNVFRTVTATTPANLLSTVYLVANQIAPPHHGLKLTLINSVAEAYGSNEVQVRKRLREVRDLGLVARASHSTMFYPQRFTVTLRTIAQESDKFHQEKKKNHIIHLLAGSTDCEAQCIIRLLQIKLSNGFKNSFAHNTVLEALGEAAAYFPPAPTRNINSPLQKAAKIIKRVYTVLPIYDKIIRALLHVGIWELSDSCNFSLGVPIRPMLAYPTKSIPEILDKFEGKEFTCEVKYDGERAQIHCMEDGYIEIYNCNGEQTTLKYPDVVYYVSRLKKPSITTFVLDCIIVAYERERKRILPFEVLSARASKGVSLSDIKIAGCTVAFDILYLNGRLLLKQQLKVRRELMYSSFKEVQGEFHFASAITPNKLEEIENLFETAVNYSIGVSLYLVPIAAFNGCGKHAGVYCSFLLACYDEQNEQYQSICNIGSGFSEAQLAERSASLNKKLIRPKCHGPTTPPTSKRPRSCDLVPGDIMLHIISMLPIESAGRLRFVCKDWLLFPYDINFINRQKVVEAQKFRVIVFPPALVSVHHEASSPVVKTVTTDDNVRSCRSEVLRFASLRRLSWKSSISHFDGLLLFSNSDSMVICNPLTRETVQLPGCPRPNRPPKRQKAYWPYTNGATIGFDSVLRVYKVVMVRYDDSSSRDKTFSVHLEVLTLGRQDLFWVAVEEQPPYPIWTVWTVASCEGIVYWLIDNTRHLNEPRAILGFDLASQNYSVIDGPPSWEGHETAKIHRSESGVSLIDLNGQLCFCQVINQMQNISVYRSEAWHPLYTLNMAHNVVMRAASLPLGSLSVGLQEELHLNLDVNVVMQIGTSLQLYNHAQNAVEVLDGSTEVWPSLPLVGEPLRFRVLRYRRSLVPIR